MPHPDLAPTWRQMGDRVRRLLEPYGPSFQHQHIEECRSVNHLTQRLLVLDHGRSKALAYRDICFIQIQPGYPDWLFIKGAHEFDAITVTKIGVERLKVLILCALGADEQTCCTQMHINSDALIKGLNSLPASERPEIDWQCVARHVQVNH